MSERIEYWITATGIKGETQQLEFDTLSAEFGEYEDETCDKKEEIILCFKDSWRGGGLSCEEVIGRHYGDWLDQNPEVKLEVTAYYLEHIPSDTFNLGGKQNGKEI